MVFEVKKKNRGQCQILQMCRGRLSVVDQYLEKIFFCLTKVNLLNWFTLRSRWLLLKMMSKGKVQLLWISKVLFTSNLLNLDINQLHWCPYRSIKYRLILRLQSWGLVYCDIERCLLIIPKHSNCWLPTFRKL